MQGVSISTAVGTIRSLWGRDFIVAYLIPALFLVLTLLSLLCQQGFYKTIGRYISTKPIWFLAFIITVSWILGIILSTASRSIVQFFEGYGAFNPLQILKPLQRYRRRCFDKKKLKYKLAVEFPAKHQDTHDDIFPTRLGNTIRSFEIYPWHIYGADPIGCWNRIIGVADKDFLEAMEALRGSTYCWINIAFASLLSIPFYYFIIYFRVDIAGLLGMDLTELSQQPASNWYALVAVLIAWGALRLAVCAAIEWGDSVKACFDLYLPKLAEHLGYQLPADFGWRRYFWQNLSQVFLYQSREAYAELQQFVKAAPNKQIGQASTSSTEGPNGSPRGD